MSDDKTGGPAFPQLDNNFLTGTTESKGGMTLRDWFAGMALQGMAHVMKDEKDAAFCAYEYADAMLKARNNQ